MSRQRNTTTLFDTADRLWKSIIQFFNSEADDYKQKKHPIFHSKPVSTNGVVETTHFGQCIRTPSSQLLLTEFHENPNSLAYWDWVL